MSFLERTLQAQKNEPISAALQPQPKATYTKSSIPDGE
jgi:hypothetical protein